MKLRHKIGLGFIGTLALLILALGLALGYEKDCGQAPQHASDAGLMQAVQYRCYGGPEVLERVQLPKPVPGPDELLVRVEAAGVNPLDWHFMRGKPYLMRLMSGIGAPKDSRLGVDFAGTVEAVGANVTRFAPGDEVFGGANGAYAEYLVVAEDRAVVRKPAGVSFDEAAVAAIAGVTALQGLRDHGRLQAGQKVLVNGASGGVGTFAVQIAKAYGAEVTGVSSARNHDLLLAIGADHVIDYRTEDFTQGGQRYDLILDMISNHSLLALRHVLEPDGVVVRVGDADAGDWLGVLAGPLENLVVAPFIDPDAVGFIARLDAADLAELARLMQQGQLAPAIDRRYPLEQVPEAIRYSEEGHARGKIVIEVDPG